MLHVPALTAQLTCSPPLPNTAGASEVVLMDREPMALHCAALSAVASGVQNVPQPHHLPASWPTFCGEEDEAQQHPWHPTTSSSSVQTQQDAERVATRSSSNGTTSTSTSSSTSSGTLRVQLFDWNTPDLSTKFDTVLACDVLYESSAVDPIAAIVPKILKTSGGHLLLADPPNRTAHNRERFIQLLGQAVPRVAVEESSVVGCEVEQLDREIIGGVNGPAVAVQLMLFRKVLGTDTVGLKM